MGFVDDSVADVIPEESVIDAFPADGVNGVADGTSPLSTAGCSVALGDAEASARTHACMHGSCARAHARRCV